MYYLLYLQHRAQLWAKSVPNKSPVRHKFWANFLIDRIFYINCEQICLLTKSKSQYCWSELVHSILKRYLGDDDVDVYVDVNVNVDVDVDFDADVDVNFNVDVEDL